jgi:hypothetical protein
MSDTDLDRRHERQRTTLATLLGTREALEAVLHELLLSVASDPERLAGVPDSQWVTVSNAALGLDVALESALRAASPDRAEKMELLAGEARKGVDHRLNAALGRGRRNTRKGSET